MAYGWFVPFSNVWINHKPFSEPIISLIIVGIGSFFLKDPNLLFQGWGNQSVWFLLAVLLACSSFRKNGLGKRMAYILLSSLGIPPLDVPHLVWICYAAL